MIVNFGKDMKMSQVEVQGEDLSEMFRTQTYSERKVADLLEKQRVLDEKTLYEISDAARVGIATQRIVEGLIEGEVDTVLILGACTGDRQLSLEGEYVFKTLRENCARMRAEIAVLGPDVSNFNNLFSCTSDLGEPRHVYFVGPLRLYSRGNRDSFRHGPRMDQIRIEGSYEELGITSMIRSLDPEAAFIVWIETNLNYWEVRDVFPTKHPTMIFSKEHHDNDFVSKFGIIPGA